MSTQSAVITVHVSVPKDLEKLLEGLSREVLREQPDNIHEFAAVHFEQLLDRRWLEEYHRNHRDRQGEYLHGQRGK